MTNAKTNITKKSLQAVLSSCYTDGGSKAPSLLSGAESNPKIAKKNGDKYLVNIMHLTPANGSGYEVCPKRNAECTAACLHTSGVPFQMKNKERGRKARTIMFFEHKAEFKALLYKEIEAFRNKAIKHDLIPAIRLNGTSDIVWERVFPDMFEKFSDVVFYDYTKIAKRFAPSWKLPANYSLTFSRSGDNDADMMNVLANGGNVAVVFSGCGIMPYAKPMPDTFNGYKVIDADKDDMRFLDPKGVIVGLRAKGKAIKTASKFVVPTAPNATAYVLGNAVQLTIGKKAIA